MYDIIKQDVPSWGMTSEEQAKQKGGLKQHIHARCIRSNGANTTGRMRHS